jgi:hypothetical protein
MTWINGIVKDSLEKLQDVQLCGFKLSLGFVFDLRQKTSGNLNNFYLQVGLAKFDLIYFKVVDLCDFFYL